MFLLFGCLQVRLLKDLRVLKKGHSNHQYGMNQNDNQLLVLAFFGDLDIVIWNLFEIFYLEFGDCYWLFPFYPG